MKSPEPAVHFFIFDLQVNGHKWKKMFMAGVTAPPAAVCQSTHTAVGALPTSLQGDASVAVATSRSGEH